MFRIASQSDLPAIAAIYDAIHTQEESGLAVIGWNRAIYPTADTAAAAIAAGEMFVLEQDDRLIACGKINHFQDECYAEGNWLYPATEQDVMVLHTLVVDPARSGHRHGTAFLEFYEDYSRKHGCHVLRLDTNARNARARAFYKKHGYREAGTVLCVFNGLPDVELVLLEKKL